MNCDMLIMVYEQVLSSYLFEHLQHTKINTRKP